MIQVFEEAWGPFARASTLLSILYLDHCGTPSIASASKSLSASNSTIEGVVIGSRQEILLQHSNLIVPDGYRCTDIDTLWAKQGVEIGGLLSVPASNTSHKTFLKAQTA